MLQMKNMDLELGKIPQNTLLDFHTKTSIGSTPYLLYRAALFPDHFSTSLACKHRTPSQQTGSFAIAPAHAANSSSKQRPRLTHVDLPHYGNTQTRGTFAQAKAPNWNHLSRFKLFTAKPAGRTPPAGSRTSPARTTGTARGPRGLREAR